MQAEPLQIPREQRHQDRVACGNIALQEVVYHLVVFPGERPAHLDGLLAQLLVRITEGLGGRGEQLLRLVEQLSEPVAVRALRQCALPCLRDLQHVLAHVADALGVLGHAHEHETDRHVHSRRHHQVLDQLSSDVPLEVVDVAVGQVDHLMRLVRHRCSSRQNVRDRTEHVHCLAEHLVHLREHLVQERAASERLDEFLEHAVSS